MKKKYIYIALLIIAGGLTSCRKYVEVKQPNSREFLYTADYQSLLNNVSAFEGAPILPGVSGDDIDVGENTNLMTQMTNGLDSIYTWGANYYTVEQSDAGWDQLYKQIYNTNLITDGVLTSTNGTETEKKEAYAEAQVQRAFAYLSLINLYAKVYSTATASTDPGVPLLLTAELFVSLKRATVQQVYDQILNDLNAALPFMPDVPSNNAHPGKAAIYALLSRTYLYMQRYPEAADNAALALTFKNTLLDLNNYGTSYPRRLDHPEVILGRKATNLGNLTLPLSNELLSKFQTNDRRYELYTRSGTSFFPAFTGRGSWKDRLFFADGVITGLTVPEMMLTQAEGLARAGQTDAALELVNALRQKRFRAEDYVALTAANAEEALNIVLDERRRELFGTGLRWLDQRRLSVEPAFAQTVTRVFKGVTYTLTPGNRYVYPIPAKNINLNPELEQNPR
jgi:starch-binding outer membrane protein, SusD/RagB family